MTDDEAGPLFAALADGTRRRILRALSQRGVMTVGEVCALFPVSRFAVMKHLNVLEAAGVIAREAAWRERRVSLRPEWRERVAAWMAGLGP